MRGWWLFAVLIACGDAGRADDCQALEVLLHAPEEMEVSMHHGQMPDTLATHDWQNPDVRAAVKKFLSPAGRHSLGRPDTGWTLYTPYTVAPQNRDLLGLVRLRATDESARSAARRVSGGRDLEGLSYLIASELATLVHAAALSALSGPTQLI